MRRIFYALWAVLAGTMALTSCLGSDGNEGIIYDNVAISSFTLGTLNVYEHTTASDGSDSVYKVTYIGSTFGISIDQINHRIFNHDSLPYGTDLKHVVCSLSTTATSIVVIKAIDSDTLWAYNSTDSIDFSVPRELMVYPTDGTAYRTYTVTLTAKEEEDDLFKWKETALEDFPGSTSVNLDSVATVIASDLRAYATEGEPVESELPTKVLGYTKWALSATATYELCAGVAPAEQGCLSLWRKVSYEGQESKWVYMPYSPENEYRLPLMEKICLANYGDAVLAAGNGTLYVSHDQGISWSDSEIYALPNGADVSSIDMTLAKDGSLWLTDGQKTWWAIPSKDLK